MWKYFSTEIKAEDCIILSARQLPLPEEKLVADKKQVITQDRWLLRVRSI